MFRIVKLAPSTVGCRLSLPMSHHKKPGPCPAKDTFGRVELNSIGKLGREEQEVKHLNNRIAITLIRSQLALYIRSNGIHCRINPDHSTSKSKWSTWDYIYNRGSKRSCCLKYFITFYLLLFNHVDFFLVNVHF